MRLNDRMATRSMGTEVQRAVLARSHLVLLAALFLTGFLLTWGLATPLRMNTSPGPTATPAAVAASYVLGLALLCICCGLIPTAPGKPAGYWTYFCAWVQTVDLSVVGFLGIWLAPGSGLRIGALLTLIALTCAYSAAWCGMHALLHVVRGRPSRSIHAALAVFLALLTTALLWTKTPLQALQRQGERGTAAYDAGTQMVAVLSPVMGWSAVWSADETGFNFTKTTHTYQCWLGPSFIRFPPLWPGRSGMSAEDRGPWGLGLVAGLLLWGLVTCLAGDWVLFARDFRHSPVSNQSSAVQT